MQNALAGAKALFRNRCGEFATYVRAHPIPNMGKPI